MLQCAEAATDLHNPSSEQTRFKSEAWTWSCKPRPRGNVHIPRGACHHPGSRKSSSGAAVKGSFCSHSQKTASPQDHFPVRIKRQSINSFKSLPRSIRTDSVKTRSWTSRATLQKFPLNTAPHLGCSKGCRCICVLSWEQASSVTSNAFTWEGKWKWRQCCQWVSLQPYQSPKKKLSKRKGAECDKGCYNTRRTQTGKAWG